MKSLNTITKTIEANKELQKNFKKFYHYTTEDFIRDGKRYLKAIKEGRMVCVIYSVSNSGMSRNLAFFECSQNKKYKNFNYLNFNAFFIALGYSKAKEGFRVSGCGMDMVFHTNYSNIRKLFKLGFLTLEECDNLAQKTPTVL